MTNSEYEDRFRRSSPSWYQILTVNQGRERRRQRRRRRVVAVAFLAAATVTLRCASHPAIDGHVGSGSTTRLGLDPLLAEVRRILDWFEAAGSG